MVYTTKKPISGYKVLGKVGAGKELVGIPTKYLSDPLLQVSILETNAVFKPQGDPLKIEAFKDKFGRGEYRLAYFELPKKEATAGQAQVNFSEFVRGI